MPLLLDKPMGYSSHDMVDLVRRILHERTVGHAGTLDPLATGLLLLLVGRVETKRQAEFMGLDKVYVTELTFGYTSSTYDAEGQLQYSGDANTITQEQCANILTQFQGTIEQVVPAYSAVKQGGRKLYQLARAGQINQSTLPKRTVTIFDLTIVAWQPPRAILQVRCTSGTYIRSLAHDIGQTLAVGAYVSALRRTRIGDYDVREALTPEQFMQQHYSDK
ncbi:MAG: tRNA pseudouridine(55) synthase TruB [Candidatus Kerfeldbacteria bacterium]|nr:tRNA pseudouridine(55) synthase TruB [Candidatus Kerfeldbacteria bacterium]